MIAEQLVRLVLKWIRRTTASVRIVSTFCISDPGYVDSARIFGIMSFFPFLRSVI